MEEQVSGANRRTRAAHLICGSKLWTIVSFACSAYFAKIGISRMQYAWSRDPWDIATHLVWVLFMAGLITETRCWKERLFFALVLANFALAFGMGLVPESAHSIVTSTRTISAGLWSLAALLSLVLMFSRPRQEMLINKAGNHG
ncbi:MAG TPA: hypothetical protein VFI95_12575 [Terriglobales bacterium]|nr:hypothetical protein [Terriglobales bacterium]